MTFLERVGLGFLGLVAIGAIVAIARGDVGKPRLEISWECKHQGDSVSCVLQNKGDAAAEVDFNLVAVCHDGEHIAHVGAIVGANTHVTKIVEGFEPSLGLFSRCVGVDFRDKTVKPASAT